MSVFNWKSTVDGKYMRAWCETAKCYVDVSLDEPRRVVLMDEFGQSLKIPLWAEEEVKAEAINSFLAGAAAWAAAEAEAAASILRGQARGCDAPGCREDWDDVTDMDLSVQHLEPLTAEHLAPVALPTLHAIGLGPQLAELERICAASAASKHAGESIRDPGAEHHWHKAAGHLTHDGTLDSRDPATNARHLIHAAARLLMAAACFDASEQSERRIAAVKDCLTTADCLDAEGETIPLNCTRCEGTGAEPPGCPESGPCEQCGGWTETKRAIARGET